MAAKVDVILLDNIRWIGNKWQIVSVSIPYAKNVLIAKWQAKIADNQTINKVKQEADKKEKDHEKKVQEIENIAKELAANSLTIQRQATAMNHLYDKIDAKDIANEITLKFKAKIAKEYIILNWKIENLWEYEVTFEYENIKKKFKIIVERK